MGTFRRLLPQRRARTRLADKYGARTVVTTPEELARTDVEAVYVASPNALHTAQSRLLLEQGKHVICEKPLSAEPEELDALNDLARKSGSFIWKPS